MARPSRGTSFVRNYKETEWREPGEGYTGEEPMKGLYPMRLVGVEPHESAEGNASTHWTFQCTAEAIGKNGDSYEGWRGHKYTNDEGAAFIEQQILVALGAIRPNGTIKTTLEELVRKYGKVTVLGRVVRERYIPEDGEPEWRAKLATVLKNRDAPRGTGSDDDDEDEADEEVEEAPPTTRTSRRASRKPAPASAADPEEDEEDEEEDDQEEEPYDLDELGEELEGLTPVQLKKRAREEFGFTTAQLRGVAAEDIIEQILDKVEAEQDGEDEEEEPEPEPPKRSKARAATATKSAASGRKRASTPTADDEPPF